MGVRVLARPLRPGWRRQHAHHSTHHTVLCAHLAVLLGVELVEDAQQLLQPMRMCMACACACARP